MQNNFKDANIIAPGIVVFDQVIDNSREIIEYSTSKTNSYFWRDSDVFIENNQVVQTNLRKTNVFDVPAGYLAEDIWYKLYKVVFSYTDLYAKNFGFTFSRMEQLQILHYPVSDGFYVPHTDDGPAINRICSAVLYLNDIDDGGETHFELFNISVQPKAGRLVIFPANYPYIHQAKTPKSQDKFCVVTWFEK